MAKNPAPDFRAYTVVKREGQDDFWLPIGAAFKHQDGEGFNIVLQALPIDGRIALRAPKDDDVPAEEGSRHQRPRDDRRGQDRRGR